VNKEKGGDQQYGADDPYHIFSAVREYASRKSKTNRLINKGTGIGDGKKEKVLLQRQAEETNADDVSVIETPDSIQRFEIIPYQKEDSCDKQSGEIISPSSVETELTVK
jgi:hypothetical protein